MDDLSTEEIEAVFSLAGEMENDIHGQTGICQGMIMASLFFEPSTRTRLSFEAAMHRLGGNVIGVSDVKTTSMAKGESIADMARIIGSYADIIVIRHPWEGAAKVVADYAGIPVINAGDGGHQHPTQTLLDLYTIKKERQTLKGLKIALWGDLKYGRTTHSLIFALAKFGADILFCPSPGLEVPPNVIRKLVNEYGGEVEIQTHKQKNKDVSFPLDAIYKTPDSPHQLAMMPDVNIEVELRKGVDAIYVTRAQKERFSESEKEKDNGEFPVVDQEFMKGKEFSKTLVMHPLPRVDELAYDMDTDPRSMYFKQAAHGVPIRMALLALLLGSEKVEIAGDALHARPDYPVYNRGYAVTCPNPRCVSVQETETKYLVPEFLITNRDPVTLRCVYCEHGFEPGFVASSDWHEGKLNNKKYHSARSRFAKSIKTENLVLFDTERQAQAMGFKPSTYADDEPGK